MNGNSTIMAAMLVASLVAGAFGGAAAGTLFGPQPPNPRANLTPATPTDKGTVADEDETDGGVDLAAELAKRDEQLEAAHNEIMALNRRLDLLEGDTLRSLKQRQDDLDARLKAAPAPGAVVEGGATGTPSAGNGVPSPEDPAFQEALDRALEERETARRERERKERDERMQQFMKQQETTILTKLSEEIALTDAQKNVIANVLQQRTTARSEVVARGMEAREKNEEFDWRGEMEAVETGAVESIRMELDASQQVKFDSLTEDGGLDSLGGGFGFGGPRRGR